MYTFTNQFSGPSLRQRVGMMNGRRSGLIAWWRYGSWLLLMGAMALACRHTQTSIDEEFGKQDKIPSSLTSPTQKLAGELDRARNSWQQITSFPADNEIKIIDGHRVTVVSNSHDPYILCIRNSHMALKALYANETKLFLNGKPAPVETLSSLTFEQVAKLSIYERKTFPRSYRLFISTTQQTPIPDNTRQRWKQFMVANAVSDNPYGQSNTFSMNKLLEATFFHDKSAFVERMKDEHLRLYDEYRKDIDLFINGVRVDEQQVNGVHVREVDKLYTSERPFEQWADVPDRKSRFVLYIQTAPKRAKRDSSYYVFSPFYSGDF